jgi:lysophospholipase L1-like esterase
MNGRRLLAGAVVAAVVATVLAVASALFPALRPDAPATEAPAPAAAGAPVVAAGPAGPQWSTAWANAPASAARNNPDGYPGYTFRNVVHTTIGGPQARIRVSNRFGTAPVRFGHVTVAVSAHSGGQRDGTNVASDGTARPGTMRDVRFGGAEEVTVPVGADALSDPVDLEVPADADLLVSVWTPAVSGRATHHPAAKQTSFMSRGPRDRAGDMAATAFTTRTSSWWYVSAVEVTEAPGTIVAFGDSITEGGASTIGGNRRWTDYLAARLAESPEPDYGVVNSGISGNRLLLDAGYPRNPIYAPAGRSGLTRFSDDVLDRAGVRTVILVIGVNDITVDPRQKDPAKLTAGLAQLAARARAQGLRVVGATITPFKGWPAYSSQTEKVRQAVNTWIRSGGAGTFDAVADFDQAVRDPADPARIRAGLHGGDSLHPNDAGQRALAGTIPLDRL